MADKRNNFVESIQLAPLSRPAVMSVEELKDEVIGATYDLKQENSIRHEDFVKQIAGWK